MISPLLYQVVYRLAQCLPQAKISIPHLKVQQFVLEEAMITSPLLPTLLAQLWSDPFPNRLLLLGYIMHVLYMYMYLICQIPVLLYQLVLNCCASGRALGGISQRGLQTIIVNCTSGFECIYCLCVYHMYSKCNCSTVVMQRTASMLKPQLFSTFLHLATFLNLKLRLCIVSFKVQVGIT